MTTQPPAWPHQHYGFAQVIAAVDKGIRRILLTSPTGGGKSRIMTMLIDHYAKLGFRACLYTNRRMLIEQTSGVLDAAGIAHGIRAAGHYPEHRIPVQISSIQTEVARLKRRPDWNLHDAAIVIVDEAHLFANPSAKGVLQRHLSAGAHVVLVTATPLDLDGMADVLIVAGKNSELRACGALVPAVHIACSEPDFRAHKKLVKKQSQLSETEVRTLMGDKRHLFGNVFEVFNRLNPSRKPTILFAPGVPESLWFAEQFYDRGITAAHIDGESVWLNGQTKPANRSARQEVLDGSANGSVSVICNRYVLREGVDAPWLQHGIFATVFGSLQPYLQSGGRLLRRHPGVDSVCIQDHGGNWHRHGSLNADQEWSLDLTADMAYAIREERLRAKKLIEPVACRNCGAVQLGTICPNCKDKIDRTKRSRPVLQTDGSLVQVHGEIFKPRKTAVQPNTLDLWTRIYWGFKKTDRTFRQAYHWFNRKHFYYPPRDLPLMPKSETDWFRLVKDVPRGDLH